MAEKAKHAFGALENIDSAISSGKIDAYDILFVKDSEGKPYVGWIDKDGKKVIVDHTPDLTKLEGEFEAQIAAKANIEDVEALEGQISTKAEAADVDALEVEIANKVDVDTVQNMIKEYSSAVIEVVEF
jgi:hypothetical protein